MTNPSPAVRSSAFSRRNWRSLLAWGVFFGALVFGVIFALRSGGSVPTLIDVVRQ